jgi:hypothetical protein
MLMENDGFVVFYMSLVSMERKRSPLSQKEGITPYTVNIRSLQPRHYFMLVNLLYK